MTQKRKFPPTPERCWEDPEGTKRVWAFIVRTERDDSMSGSGGGYRHLRFELVSVADVYNQDERRIRNSLASEAYDLQIYSQGNQYSPDDLYAYEVNYGRSHHLDLAKVTCMYRFLSTLEKKMERESQELGRPLDFASYVTRVARILGVHYLIEKRSETEFWSEYDSGDYRYTSLRKDGRFNGRECMDKVQDLVRKLWTDLDRNAAKAFQERKEQERKDREAAEEEAEAGNG